MIFELRLTRKKSIIYSVQLKWVEKPNDIVVSLGKQVEIACKAVGSPQPKIYWKRLDSEQDITIESSILQLRSTSLKDKGLYECRASNGFDEDLVARVQLDVRGK